MGLLNGGLQRVALGAFGSILLAGKIAPKRVETRDDRGRIVTGAPGAQYDCKAFFDTVTDAMRASGYTAKDVRVVCLQLDFVTKQPIPPPEDGGQLVLRGGTYRIAVPIDEDAAQAAWTFRATPI